MTCRRQQASALPCKCRACAGTILWVVYRHPVTLSTFLLRVLSSPLRAQMSLRTVDDCSAQRICWQIIP